MEQGQKDQSCNEVPQLSAPPEIRGFYQVDLRLVDALHQVGEANGCPLTPTNSRAVAEFYSVLQRVFSNGNDTHTLQGKEGRWKQVDQEWLANSTGLSDRTIRRRLKTLEAIGVIRYAKQGWIAKKYLQVISLEQAWRDAISDDSGATQVQQKGDKVHTPATRVSESTWTDCPSRSGQSVRVEADKLSESNKRQLTKQPSLDNLDLTASGENAEESSPSSNRVFTRASQGEERVEKEQGQPEQPQRSPQALVDATQVESDLPVPLAPFTPEPFAKREQPDAREKQPRRYRIWSAEDLDRMNAARQSTANAS